MKSIKNYLNESLLDDDDVFYDPENDKKEIENWIRSNCKVTGKLTILKDYTVNCAGNVFVTNGSITSLTNGLFKWGKINKNFSCTLCDIKSLEGAPEKVGGSFICIKCNNLISLEGAPEEVEEYFDCSDCKKLESLKGSPRKVNNNFLCNDCNNLKSLEGAPKKVGGDFMCAGCDDLTSLEGAPEWVGKKIYCYDCKNLKITDSDREKYKIED